MLRKSEEPFLISRQAAFRPSKRLPSLSKAYAGVVFARRPLRAERRKRKRRTEIRGEEAERRGSQFGRRRRLRQTRRRRRESTNPPRKESSIPLLLIPARSLNLSLTNIPRGDRQTGRQIHLRFPRTYVRHQSTHKTDFTGEFYQVGTGFLKFIPSPSPRRLLTFKSRMAQR